MRIAYFISIDIEKYSGVVHKIADQCLEWEKQQQNVHIFCVVPTDSNIENTKFYSFVNENKITFYFEDKLGFVPVDTIKNWLGVRSVYDQIQEDIGKYKPDIIYSRIRAYSPFLKNIGSNFPLICEVNTLEKSEYKLQAFESLRYFLRYIFHLFTRKTLFRQLQGVVTVTNEIANEISMEYGKSTIVCPNSINFNNVDEVRKYNYSNSERIRLCFIGTDGMSWHGLDILLKIAAVTTDIMEFDIIGFKNYNNTLKNVKYYGVLDRSEYKKILLSADIGVGTLALFRKHMDEANPLKVREYLSFGLPIVIAYDDTAFLESRPEWVLKLPNNEDGILSNVKRIIEFGNRYKGVKIDQDEVRKYIDISVIERKRIGFLKKNIR